MRLKARKLPDDGPRNGWYETLPAPPPPRRVRNRVAADLTVIGGKLPAEHICGEESE